MFTVIKNCNMPIFFVGMMGSGKTTIGKGIAQILGFKFIDMDTIIEANEKLTIKEIFEQNGEAYFRKKEFELLQEIVKKKNVVISCGGGVFTFEENIKIINENGVSVFLNVDAEILQKRLKHDTTRPMLKNGNSVFEILQKRLPFYKQAKVIVEFKKSEVKNNVLQCIESLNSYLYDIKHVWKPWQDSE